VIVCSVCIYIGRPGDAVPDGADPQDMVVVMNGQSVCIDHAGLAGNGGDRHYMITTAVRERGYDTLSELQVANSAARRARDAAAGS
jgi:hypothetical protein